MATITFSASTTKGLRNKVKKEIMESLQGDKEMRAEMRKVFQTANRRIQNIEKSGLFSPAVASLGKGDIKGYSKFSVKGFGSTGDDWKHLKKEYAKAVSFLNQPTSMARGAREFEQHIKKTMNIDEKLWQGVRDSVLGNYNSVSSQLLLSLPYADFIQDVYNQATQDSSSLMEQESKETADNLEKQIEEIANKVADIVEDANETMIDSIMEQLVKGFKM